ncbi:MAG TPA: serine acetyltransferase [Cyanothece sp. UBA12306]|nr:serine acetyltransferase [Cyanothece sp. UBA12306]
MKSFLKSVLFWLSIFCVSPLIIPFLLTSEKTIIISDVKRWQELLGWQNRMILIQLLALLKEAQQFRNIYYFRLFNGNFLGKILMYLLKIIYRECPYFFLDSSCNIGSGLFIQHGFSTIIMADLGDNCWVNQQVTIGYKDKTGRPKIGNNVRITAGAKVIGNIKIGDNVTIGANAVVTKDVPDNCVVVGIPAYIIKRDGVKVREEL